MKTNPNDAAFARPVSDFIHSDGSRHAFSGEYGLTKLEYFSLHILAGMRVSTSRSRYDSYAYYAVKEAKALIDELNKEGKDE